ncbi:DUF945 family protein [Vibrio sp. 404]|uniref:DUF945 family protein n=1 Tax=Vibrio marinisediminis TaxID=2758441 RepID=A0A7W2FRW2_9VIBR|nr:DUF945 family protein [Vibrio marinisediminis]MBA5763067.1 DUF945 family protein [Vibrio marinisediminis]
MSSMVQLRKFAAIGGAISLALCWPLAVGQIGQNVIEDSVAKLNSDALTAEIVSYDRGYLSSTVTTRYVVTDPVMAAQLEADGVPAEIVVNSNIQHGLISLSADSVMDNWTEIPLTLHTVTQLNGNTDFEFKLDNWHQSTEGEDGAMMLITPSTLKGHATVLGQVDYELTVPSIEVDFNSGEKLLVENVTGQGSGKKVNSFWIGDQMMKIEQMSVFDPQQTVQFNLKNGEYVYSAEYAETTERVASKHTVSVGEVTVEQESLENLEIDFAFGDLDAASFEQLVTLYQNSPMLTAQDLQEMIPYLDNLFSKGFYLSSDKISMNIGDGEFTSQWKLIVPQGTDNVSQDPMKVMPALQGHFDSFISNALVDQYPAIQQTIDEGVIMEFVKQTDQGYQVKAEIKEGNIVFEGGQKVPLMSLLLPFMM